MKKIICLFMAFTMSLAFVNCHHPDHDQPQADNWPGYQAFPQGYGYMDTAQLQRALHNQYIDTIRQHAWSLFAGIMQPAANGSGWPLWYTWPNSNAAMQIGQMFGKTQLLGGQLEDQKALSLIARNKLHIPIELDTLHAPYYRIPQPVINAYAGKGVFSGNFIIPGKHFMFNGDILIASESISIEGYDWIQDNRFYDSTVIMDLYRSKPMVPNLQAPPRYVVTKHMYWPVLNSGMGVVPVWRENYFNYFYAGYAGYEKWTKLVAIDPTNHSQPGQTQSASYLYGIKNFDSTAQLGPITDPQAAVHNMNEFYWHKVTQADWNDFNDNDKAILNASSYWVYGKPFGVGDYLVTIAMHVNTKELPSWTMQSAWWTDQPDLGMYAANKPSLPNATGPWSHYDMVQAYGVPVVNGNLQRGTNPYIELVTHPMNTNCNNCHMRAGYPSSSGPTSNFASYQNPTCKDLLEKLYPGTPCLSYYTRTDFQWIISDYTHAVPAKK